MNYDELLEKFKKGLCYIVGCNGVIIDNKTPLYTPLEELLYYALVEGFKIVER